MTVLNALMRFTEYKIVIMVTYRQATLPLVDIVYDRHGSLMAKILQCALVLLYF
ncbi:MAG: hypothetical protein NTV00_09315 [Methylococcales bacterium]|nr:hypothetical protein [Methylococcales bacterium]